jgi:hypothetical protein
MSSRGTLATLAAAIVFVLAPAAIARQAGPGAPKFLTAVDSTRIVDPKLDQARASVTYKLLPAAKPYRVEVTVYSPSNQPLATLFRGMESGSASPITRYWDCRDAANVWYDPGTYRIRVEAAGWTTVTNVLDFDVDIVRLGIESIAAGSSVTPGPNEWQMVYFRKNGAYAFYATPATGEYLSTSSPGDLSVLDLNDGSPRPAPTPHQKTDEPLLEINGSTATYEDDYFNYPLCYQSNAAPSFTLKFGASCTSAANGLPATCNYPVSGWDLRCVGSDSSGAWTTTATAITPGGTETVVGPALTKLATRSTLTVKWRWEYRPAGSTGAWSKVPGAFSTEHRIYTIHDKPYWATGASGTQYAGPWVEVAEYLYTWATALGVTTDNNDRVVEAFIKGYFGQNGTITTAIEGVKYDCPSVGGDGGATHYFDWTIWKTRLSRLLNNHAFGLYVNCTDCAGSTSAMLSMLGVSGYRMDRLGSMTLRAIWGIGTATYTLDLWSNGGGAGHGFSYHHIITRDGGTTISDACLWVDEDGNPDTLPGTPGYNNDRAWTNYMALLAKANVTWSLDLLPKID